MIVGGMGGTGRVVHCTDRGSRVPCVSSVTVFFSYFKKVWIRTSDLLHPVWQRQQLRETKKKVLKDIKHRN